MFTGATRNAGRIFVKFGCVVQLFLYFLDVRFPQFYALYLTRRRSRVSRRNGGKVVFDHVIRPLVVTFSPQAPTMVLQTLYDGNIC